MCYVVELTMEEKDSRRGALKTAKEIMISGIGNGEKRFPPLRGPEDLHQGIQALGQGAKKTFTKGSKALTKEPRRSSPRGLRPWPRSQEDLHQGIQCLGQGVNKAFTKEPRTPSPRDPLHWPRSQEDLQQRIQGLGQGIKKVFTKGSKALAKEPRRPSPRDPRH